MNITNWLITPVVTSVPIFIFIGLVTYFCKDWLLAKIIKKIETEQKLKLAEFDAEISKAEADRKSFEETNIRNEEFIRRSVESTRNHHSTTLNDLRIEAVKSLWESVVLSYKVRILIAQLQSLNVDEILNQSNDNSIKEFMNVIASTSNVDQYLQEIAQQNVNKYRPFIPQKLWEYYSAYMSVISTALMVMKTVEFGVGDKKLYDFGSAAEEVFKIAPFGKEGFEKFGWTFMFHQDKILENAIISEIRKFVDGDELDEKQITLATNLNQSINDRLGIVQMPDIPKGLENPNN